jgi:carboxypeptidase PM20D1
LRFKANYKTLIRNALLKVEYDMPVKRILFSLLMAFTLLLVVLLSRTFLFAGDVTITDTFSAPKFEKLTVSKHKISQHLSKAITFKTISQQNSADIDYHAFSAFIDWLAQTYPQVHKQLKLIRINEFTLLYQWQGSDSALSPILLSGHYDVVPIIPGSEQAWEYPPFAGMIADEFIWGRGTLDDKSAVIGLLEALTILIDSGFSPKRTIYVAATHDEEIGSKSGATGVVNWMKENNVQPAWSLDEGSFVLNGLVPGVELPVASINVAEKGFMNLELKVSATGGHSSMPKGHTAVGILSTAIHNLQNNPLDGSLEGITGNMFNHLAPYMPFVNRVLFANKWLFSGLIEHKLSQSSGGNATLRTTIAPTMLSGSIKANILPINASAIINFRLHPNDTVDSVVEHVIQVIDDDRVVVKVIEGSPASQVADYQGQGFQQIASVAKHVHGSVVVSPGLTIAATDSRKYEQVAKDSYRFNPMSIGAKDIEGFHGTNERLSIDNLLKATEFYVHLMRSASE